MDGMRDKTKIGDTVQAQILKPQGCIVRRVAVRGTVMDVDRFGVLAEMDDRPGELMRLPWLNYGRTWEVL